MAKKYPYSVNTTAFSAGTTSVKPQGVNTTAKINPQKGGNGNASTNPYNNAFQSYRTNMNKVRNAQIGQLNTDYNLQQKQIRDNYNGLNRNAYVTYMKRNLANRNAVSNMGIGNSAMNENMQTANAVDYNRSVGNVGAYKIGQMSNARNAYNTNVASVNNEYANNMMNTANQFAQANIARNNEIADLKASQRFTARENAKDRAQSAKEANQSLKATRQQNRFQVFADTISGYTSINRIDKTIKKLKTANKKGTLKGWKKEYYNDMLSYLRAQRNVVKQKAKGKTKAKKKS